MITAQKSQCMIPQRLYADGKPVDTCRLQPLKVHAHDVIRIGFNCNFSIMFQAETVTGSSDQPGNGVGGQQGRRPSPKIKTVGRPMLWHARTMDRNIFPDCLQQGFQVAVLGCVHIEVAVWADLRTVRPVDVDSKSILWTELRGFHRHDSSAALSFSTARAR